MARKRNPSRTPAPGKPSDPVPPAAPSDGWEDEVITWNPPSPAKRVTVEDWLDDVLARAPQGEDESNKAYFRRLFEIARIEGIVTTAGTISTRFYEKRRTAKS
jgi:hypothetical protein